jgi:hypothetical protein
VFQKLSSKDLTFALGTKSVPRISAAWFFMYRRLALFSHGVYPSWLGMITLAVRGRKPKTFQEKLSRRLTLARSKDFKMFGDKLLVKKFIGERIGPEYLPKIFSIWEPGQDVDWNCLPREFVAKSNHGVGGSMIVWDGSPQIDLPNTKDGEDWRIVHSTPAGLNRNLAECFFNKWAKQDYAKKIDEYPQWFYRKVSSKVIFEELLLTENRTIPEDFKFLCFDGKCKLVLVERNRFSDFAIDLFDAQGGSIEGGLANVPNSHDKWELPENFQEMVRISEKLAEGFDFLSVDLYSIDNRIVAGEVAVAVALNSLFYPQSLEEWVGALWTLPKNRGIFL